MVCREGGYLRLLWDVYLPRKAGQGAAHPDDAHAQSIQVVDAAALDRYGHGHSGPHDDGDTLVVREPHC